MLTSRRLWGGLLALLGAISGGAVLSEAQIAEQIDHIIAVVGTIASLVGGLLSLSSKFFPKRS